MKNHKLSPKHVKIAKNEQNIEEFDEFLSDFKPVFKLQYNPIQENKNKPQVVDIQIVKNKDLNSLF